MLTRNQAELLTIEIAKNLTDFGTLIKQARDGKAWKVLGYASFGDWLQQAVGISRARAYQLINIASLEADLREIAPLPSDFTLTSRAVQHVINFGSEEFLAKWKHNTDEHQEENEKVFYILLSEVRDELSGYAEHPTLGNVTNIDFRDKNQHVLIAMSSLQGQLDEFPTPDEVDDEHLLIVRGKLRDAISRIEVHIEDYSMDGTRSGAVNA